MKLTSLKSILLFSALLCLSCSLSHGSHEHNGLPRCRKTDYTFSTLALTWIGEYCTEHRCHRNWRNVWDGKSFAIHGYWPASRDLAFLSCQNDNKQNGGYDRHCYRDYDFDGSRLSSMKAELNEVWPQIGSIKNFWDHEWTKHGTCYLKLTMEKNNPGRLSEDQIYDKYFQGAIDKYNYLYLDNLTRFKYNSKEELAIDLGLYEDEFAVVCGGDDQVDEIRVCYDLAEPGKEQIIRCPSKPRECKYPTYLKQKN